MVCHSVRTEPKPELLQLVVAVVAHGPTLSLPTSSQNQTMPLKKHLSWSVTLCAQNPSLSCCRWWWRWWPMGRSFLCLQVLKTKSECKSDASSEQERTHTHKRNLQKYIGHPRLLEIRCYCKLRAICCNNASSLPLTPARTWVVAAAAAGTLT